MDATAVKQLARDLGADVTDPDRADRASELLLVLPANLEVAQQLVRLRPELRHDHGVRVDGVARQPRYYIERLTSITNSALMFVVSRNWRE